VDRRNVRKRPRGRPRTSNHVIILPVHRKPEITEISRAFIELGLHFSSVRDKIGSKRSKGAGLLRQRKVELDYHG
jgi:hypothetical protein